jgi:hypothetical protein
VTVTADNKRRVVLPSAKPGDLFQVEISGEGTFTLTRLEPIQERPSPVRFKKRGKFTVGVSDRPVSQEAIDQALADFP